MSAPQHSLASLIDARFDVVVYGVPFEGLHVDAAGLGTQLRRHVVEAWAAHGLPAYPDGDETAAREWQARHGDTYARHARPGFAVVRGYRAVHDGEVVRLPREQVYLVIGQGEDCLHGAPHFADGSCRMWSLGHPTVRLDLAGGTFGELANDAAGVPMPEDADAAPDAGFDGATLLRSATGDSYLVPGDLDAYEIDPDTDAELAMLGFEPLGDFEVSVAPTSNPAARAALAERMDVRPVFAQRLAGEFRQRLAAGFRQRLSSGFRQRMAGGFRQRLMSPRELHVPPPEREK